MRSTENLQAQRQHVWSLLIPLFAAGSEKGSLWDSWYSEGDVFATSDERKSPKGVRQFSRPSSVSHESRGHRSEFPDAPIFNYTLYNRAAYEHIRSYHLNRTSELEVLRRRGPKDAQIVGNRSVPPFPLEAMVVKTIWWPISSTGMSSVPVWVPIDNTPHRAGYSYLKWQTHALIDPASEATNAPSTDRRHREYEPTKQAIYGLGAFVHFSVDASFAMHANADGEARRASVIALGRPLRSGDILLLVGVNLAAKEIENWVWAALWWHDEQEREANSLDGPQAPRPPLSHYLLQVAFDADRPTEANGEPHICFNPWLEARFPDGGHGSGLVSNCLTCHSRASYPSINFLPVTRGSADRKSDPAFALGRLRTGFLWSIALHGTP